MCLLKTVHAPRMRASPTCMNAGVRVLVVCAWEVCMLKSVHIHRCALSYSDMVYTKDTGKSYSMRACVRMVGMHVSECCTVFLHADVHVMHIEGCAHAVSYKLDCFALC